MDAGDLSQLQRVEDQADVSVPRKPDAVRLVGRLVARPALVRMPADVEHRRQASRTQSTGCPTGCPAGRGLAGTVKVARHVESRAALVVQHLDRVTVALECAGDRGGKRRFFRHRRQAQHVVIFRPVLRPQVLPLLARSEALQECRVDLLGLAGEILLDHPVAGGIAVGRTVCLAAGRKCAAREPCQEHRRTPTTGRTNTARENHIRPHS